MSEVTIHIPDDLANRMIAAGCDLSRKALQALTLEEYRNGRLTDPEFLRFLGFETRYETLGLQALRPAGKALHVAF